MSRNKTASVEEVKSTTPAVRSLPGRISKEDHDAIQNLKANAAFCKALAQKAVAEQRTAELEVQAAVLRTYMKYGMSASDQIDGDGNIVRVEVATVNSVEDSK